MLQFKKVPIPIYPQQARGGVFDGVFAARRRETERISSKKFATPENMPLRAINPLPYPRSPKGDVDSGNGKRILEERRRWTSSGSPESRGRE